jgi:hypothetical protein
MRLLQIPQNALFNVVVRVTYRSEWPDGFGARGWKLDIALDDPEIIASTPNPGARINTSVLVHDILDHHVSGFPPSGHRNEAMALIQLSTRTGSDPGPDYEQMVDEDLMHGVVYGESMRSFLPPHVVQLLPSDILSGKEAIDFLVNILGHDSLRTVFVERLFELGYRGVPLAQANWNRRGLGYERSTAIGICLQWLLEEADQILVNGAFSFGTGFFQIGNQACRITLEEPLNTAFNKLV